ncbi:tRNA (adenosine(37)-N6)-threonylcarbamoyltransferase complex dimerization subunit type 1 TsaB [Myxococcota bacterium]|nr:tRNA (adenosine(37)-N6)-threonylcarbamoyltransferase complex dimerization subunit type 1 TsaB [Myxococcota bacterium]MCZ7619422.1 tRNA (adenosine(37)-N6)-threonylcarbamoyltransferase complex dimerization subunit type 1 TsaB [Myxococcota bacterium]
MKADPGWLLAIESATAVASAALLRNGELRELRTVPLAHPASEALLPTVLALLAGHRVAVVGLDALAVSIGPGSFTGLRVGVATAKGLAFGAGARSLPVPTLAALAAKGASDAPAGARVVAVLDARRGEVYAACYEGADRLSPPVWGPTLATPAELLPRLAVGEGPLHVIGDGVSVLEPVLRESLGERVVWVPAPGGAPDAAWVGRLGFEMLASGAAIDAAELTPRYLRRAEAEVRRTGDRFESV